MSELIITTEYIELKNALKLLGIVETGGQVKMFLVENKVMVNDEREERRGRKLFDGDVIKVFGKTYTIRYAGTQS